MPRKKKKTIIEVKFPETEKFAALARQWTNDASSQLLELVWGGYDLLRSEILAGIDLNQASDDLERSLTQQLEPRIQRVMSGDEPFYVQHGPYEYETRQAPPAQPPQYDIGFLLNANPRIIWPLEAKVLQTDKAVGSYVTEVKQSYLTCRYSPFSSQAAMLGYLVNGKSSTAFKRIALKLPCKMRSVAEFTARSHKVSNHRRKVPKGKRYPSRFKCHHLLLPLQ